MIYDDPCDYWPITRSRAIPPTTTPCSQEFSCHPARRNTATSDVLNEKHARPRFCFCAVVLTAVSADETLRDGITVEDLVNGDCNKGIASHGDRVSLLYVGYEGAEADPGKIFHSTASHTPFTFVLGDMKCSLLFLKAYLRRASTAKGASRWTLRSPQIHQAWLNKAYERSQSPFWRNAHI